MIKFALDTYRTGFQPIDHVAAGSYSHCNCNCNYNKLYSTVGGKPLLGCFTRTFSSSVPGTSFLSIVCFSSLFPSITTRKFNLQRKRKTDRRTEQTETDIHRDRQRQIYRQTEIYRTRHGKNRQTEIGCTTGLRRHSEREFYSIDWNTHRYEQTSERTQ